MQVSPPAVAPSPHGLLSVVQLRDEVDPHWQAGVQWEPLCGGVGSTYDPCLSVSGIGAPVGSPPAKGDSTLTEALRGATPFTVYADFDCSPAGWADHAHERAVEALTLREPWQVERTFWSGLAGGQGVAFPHLAADTQVEDAAGVVLQTAATSVTGAVLDVVEGLGRLEQALADCLGGSGVVHVPVLLLPALAAHSLIVSDGPQLRTQAGNLVAAGAGYSGTGPSGAAPSDGTAWMYTTGPVFGYRSQVRAMPPASIVNRETNTVTGIAERTYVLGFSCCHHAVLVSAGGEVAGAWNSGGGS